MNVGISAIRTKDIRINRHELVNKLQELGHNVMYIGQESNDRIHPDYKKYNVKFLSIPMTRSNVDPLQEIKSIWETKKVLKENNIEALIVYGIRTFPAMVLAARLAGVKKILCVVNGSGRLFQLNGFKGTIVKMLSYPMLVVSFCMANKILFQNPDDMKMVKGKGLLWKRNYSTISGSGVNLTEYDITKLNERPVFTMISRLTGSKGVNEFVQAAFKVKKSHPEATFHLIGPLDNEDSSINMDDLQKAIDKGVIILTGKVEDVRPYLNQCRVFVLPSYYPEGIPRSILEAMAVGRPIITTNSPGCRETVINEFNGFLVEPRNVVELAKKMIWMIENGIEVKKMGENSRRLCEEKFDVNIVNKQMLNSINLIKKV